MKLRTGWRVAGLVAVLVGMGGVRAGARQVLSSSQNQPTTTNGQPAGPRSVLGNDSTGLSPETRAKMEAQQARAQNVDRHKKMLADADRMVQLSNELKDEVEKSNKDELSLTVIKKAAEIEKLAHDVKERMRE